MAILRGDLNNNQNISHHAAVCAALLDNGQSIPDRVVDIGRLNVLLGKRGGGKSHTINAIITTLIIQHGFMKDK